MHHEYHYLEDKKAQLHYSKYGSGKNVLLCFHGYGQSHQDFRDLEEQLKTEYTIYSFDIFYHGKSFWHEKDHPISKADWCSLIDKFLKENKIERFSIKGFSMGGKFSLALVECFPEKIDKIIFIAPDGIKTNLWYFLAAYPALTRAIFRKIILKPGFFFKLLKTLRFLHLVDKGLLRFAEGQMKTRHQRRRVYYTWVVFRELKFDMKVIATLLKKYNIRVEMFLGKYDKIITFNNMKVLLNKISNYEVHVLESGHSHLIKAVAEYFKRK